MKWIGQHIWDFISRFRSDVYLEGTETGTIASGGNLGLDANNKIVKAASGSGDLTITDASNNRIVTSSGGTDLLAETYATFVNSGNSSTFQLISNENSAADYLTVSVTTNGETSFLTVDDDAALAHMNFTADGKITMTPADINGDVFHLDANADSDNIVNIDAGTLDVDVTGNTSVDTVEFVVEHQTTGTLTVQNTGASASGGLINIKNTNNGTDANVSDYCGYIKFWGQDDGTPAITEYGRIDTQIADVADGDEAGTMRLQVLNNTGTGALLDGIAMYGNTDVDGDINVDIASGTSSTTTIAGDLDIDGDTITSAGVLKIIPADVSGLALHIDADADTDNEVQIDAGVLDVNVTATATVDVATSLTITGKTLMNNRTLTVTAGSAAGEFDGDVVYTGTTTGMTTGAVYFYNSSGQWQPANGGTEGTTKGLLAIALGAESDTHGMLLRGMVTTTTVSGTQDEGAALYLRATNGVITTVAPNSSGQCVRVVGYCMENSNNRIYFNPDNTYIEIA